MAEEMTMEQQAGALDAAYASQAAAEGGQEGGAQGAPAQGAPGAAKAGAENGESIPAWFSKYVEEQRQYQNRVNSQLGQFSKRNSDLDKFFAEQNKPKSPQSWDKLDASTQAATRELVKHLVEELYGEKFKGWDKIAEGFQTQERNERIMGIAHQALGDDYGKYDKLLGDLYRQIKGVADSGDPAAKRFLDEIHSTDSGVYRLVEMAKAKLSQSIQAQGDTAKLEREAAAKRAAAGVRGGQPAQPGQRADGLPADKTARRAQMAAMIDEANSKS